MAASILVVEGNTRSATERMVELGGRPYGESYATLLESLSENVSCVVAHPADEDTRDLPDNETLAGFDGIVWTGSAMSVYEDRPEVTNQLRFAERCAASGAPIFGSCWGLQVVSVALGGHVHKNPRGREIPVGRDIALTEEGKAHPMYEGKPAAFDALTVHMDEVDEPPKNAVILARNSVSDVQALAVESSGISFWGVQYHPEFDFRNVVTVMRRMDRVLVDEGTFDSEERLKEAMADFACLDSDAGIGDTAAGRYGLTEVSLDDTLRRLELSNWLTSRVLPRASG